MFLGGSTQTCLAENIPDKPKNKSTKRKRVTDKAPQINTGAVVVKRGDTLSEIAQGLKAEGGSIEQRMVAFYRANRNVFVGDNMNRISAGKALGVPNSKEIVTVKPVEAKREIHKQVKVWHQYKKEVAIAKEEAKKAKEVAEAKAVASLDPAASATLISPSQPSVVDKPESAIVQPVATQAPEAITPPTTVVETPAPTFENAIAEDEAVLRFEIRSYTLDGATLLSKNDIDRTVAQYIGKDKDFSDVQRALEAIEELYAKKGISAVHVLLPEQELEQGDVHFHVIESKFGKVLVKNAKLIKYISDQNAINALPSVRAGNIPRSKQIARELKLANENPARQLNVVLKASESDEFVDASIVVTDTKPGAWGITYDNSGTPETGRSRMGLSYRHANLFDKDHMLSMQTQVSPEQMDRVRVFSGSYHVPFYQWGTSADFSTSYSNVNSLVNATSSYQGGATIVSARYNYSLEKLWVFDPKLIVSLDLRDFMAVSQTVAPVTVLYNEILTAPLGLSYSAQGKFEKADVGFNLAYSANLPGLSKGQEADFANYDLVNLSKPNPQYQVLRFGANYAQSFFGDWQFRTGFNGQASNDYLIQGEQIRLGGIDGVRGFSEGSEGGEKGIRGNIEFYAPAFSFWGISTRSLIFYDAGQASTNAGANTSIAGYGFGLRSSYSDNVMLRLDAGRIVKEGIDPQQKVGDGRVHLMLSASF